MQGLILEADKQTINAKRKTNIWTGLVTWADKQTMRITNRKTKTNR